MKRSAGHVKLGRLNFQTKVNWTVLQYYVKVAFAVNTFEHLRIGMWTILHKGTLENFCKYKKQYAH